MNFYFEPVNLNQWSMFDKVKSIGHVETFLATKEMNKGDLLLLNVGKQNSSIETGVYAIAEVISEPYVLQDHPEDYCNGKLSVNTKIVKIDYEKPIIKSEICKIIFSQFRTVHKIKEDKKVVIYDALEGQYEIIEDLKMEGRVLKASTPETSFHTITEALNYSFNAQINYVYQKGTYPLKKNLWKYYMAWFPNFAFIKDDTLIPGSGTLNSNWFNIISEDGSEIIEYNYGEPREKYEPEKEFYRLVFGRKRKEDYKFLGVYRMTSPYEDNIDYAYRRYERVTDSFDTSTIHKKPTFDIDTSYVDAVYKIPEISETEKEILAKARVGQGIYRENLISKHDGKCMMCGMRYKGMLIASHIKEWSEANNEERLDVNNGLLLCVLHDALFDKHLISFDEEGQIMISTKLNEKDVALCNISEKEKIEMTNETKYYMEYHRKKFNILN